jgi:hypothetical protein
VATSFTYRTSGTAVPCGTTGATTTDYVTAIVRVRSSASNASTAPEAQAKQMQAHRGAARTCIASCRSGTRRARSAPRGSQLQHRTTTSAGRSSSPAVCRRPRHSRTPAWALR